MNRTSAPIFTALLAFGAGLNCQTQTLTAPAATEATLYSTMPSKTVHRPEMALDGDMMTYFQSAYGMNEGDDFTVLFSRPVNLRGVRVSTGNPDGDNLLTKSLSSL